MVSINKEEVSSLINQIKEDADYYSISKYRVQDSVFKVFNLYVLDDVANLVAILITSGDLETANDLLLNNLLEREKVVKISELIENLNEDEGVVSYRLIDNANDLCRSC